MSSHPAPVITVDGPSGAGKGTVSAQLSRLLGLAFLDSGALYRLVAWQALDQGVSLDDDLALAAIADQLDVSFEVDDCFHATTRVGDRQVDRDIRTETVATAASRVAAMPAVRAALLDRQRRFARPPGLVADGRDMGTVVFPEAPCKLFITASPEERARRRYKQLKDKGLDVTLRALFDDIVARDQLDSSRKAAPLKPADDAVIVDTTNLSVDEVVQFALEVVSDKLDLEPERRTR